MTSVTLGSGETMIPTASPKNHLPAIDALRGLAALYVILFHTALVPQPNLLLPVWAKPIILQGWSGVSLFFVISAFTLTLSVRTRRTGLGTILPFYIRRVFRIVPLYYLWLAVSVIRDGLFLNSSHPKRYVMLCMIFGYNFLPGKSEGIVWASWTLGVEMLFYLAFPFLFRIVNTLPKSIAFFIVSLVAAHIFRHFVYQLPLSTSIRDSFYHFGFFHALPLFAAGMVTFFAYERWLEGQIQPQWIGALLITLSGVGFILLAYTEESTFLLEKWYWSAFVYSFLMIGLTILPLGLLVNKVTRFYGDVSYSMYLNHPTIIFFLATTYRLIYAHTSSVTVSYSVCLLLTLAIVTPLSWVTYRFIEQPFIKFGGNLIKKMASKVAVA